MPAGFCTTGRFGRCLPPKKNKSLRKNSKNECHTQIKIKVPFKEMKLANMKKPLANIGATDPLPATDLFGGQPPTKRTGKKPRPYNDKLAEDICNRLMQGESLRQICAGNEPPAVRRTILYWLANKQEFRQLYAAAREIQADLLAEEILAIADQNEEDWVKKAKRGSADEQLVFNTEHVQRAKLRIDARKWLIARLAPKKYGLVDGEGQPDNQQLAEPWQVQWLVGEENAG